MSGDDDATDPDALRRRAEARVGGGPAAGADAEKLLYELRVHQAELEMQNDELRRIQRELEDSRDRYHDLYDRAPIGYVTLDAYGTILEANLTATVMLGLERRHLIRRKLSSFVDDAKGFHLYRREVFAGPEKRSVDLQIRRRDGHAFPAHLDSTSIADVDGTPVRCRTVLIDLSALRLAQEDARSQKSKAEAILHAAPDAILTLDDECVIQSANPAAGRLFGLHEIALRGLDVSTLVPALAERCRRGITPPGEATVQRPDGTRIPVEIAAAEWRDHGGFRLTATLRDLTERLDAEQRLRRSESRFREIAETIEDAFHVTEREGRVVYLSPAFEEIWGRPVEEIYENPRSWIESVHAEDRARMEAARERQLVAGAAFDESYRIHRPDGSVRWVHDRSFAVEGAAGGAARFIGVARDVTAERDLERELLHAQKIEAIGTLASGIAHDFGNLLQAIIASVQLVMDDALLPEQSQKVLAKAEAAALRGARLTHQITSFASKDRPEARPLELDAIVDDSLDLLRRLVGPGVEIVADTASADALVMADSVLLEHILMNLAVNARDAMSGRGTLTIATRVVEIDARRAASKGLRQGAYVRLDIRDTGVGMDERTRERVFEPFFTTKERGKGTGLGLSTVFASTRTLGGHVAIESEPGRGTAFVFHFPRHGERRPAEPAPDVSSEGTRALRVESEAVAQKAPLTEASPRGCVLVVEPDDAPRAAIERHLVAQGYEVFATDRSDRGIAWAAARQAPVDVLVVEATLPAMSGGELADRLRRARPHLAVIILSKDAAPAAPGGERVLRKPVPLFTLSEEIERVLGRAGRAAE